MVESECIQKCIKYINKCTNLPNRVNIYLHRPSQSNLQFL